jgi:hypothetical protein
LRKFCSARRGGFYSRCFFFFFSLSTPARVTTQDTASLPPLEKRPTGVLSPSPEAKPPVGQGPFCSSPLDTSGPVRTTGRKRLAFLEDSSSDGSQLDGRSPDLGCERLSQIGHHGASLGEGLLPASGEFRHPSTWTGERNELPSLESSADKTPDPPPKRGGPQEEGAELPSKKLKLLSRSGRKQLQGVPAFFLFFVCFSLINFVIFPVSVSLPVPSKHSGLEAHQTLPPPSK